MKIRIDEKFQDYGHMWGEVRKLALATVGKKPKSTKPVTYDWKCKILKSQHSPIRVLTYKIEMQGIPYWVSNHFVRHSVGVTHFVQSQRINNTDGTRGDIPQGAPVNHTMVINAQALINMARRRLCGRAADTTREVMEEIRLQMRGVDEVLSTFLVRDCDTSVGCNEGNPCYMGKE